MVELKKEIFISLFSIIGIFIFGICNVYPILLQNPYNNISIDTEVLMEPSSENATQDISFYSLIQEVKDEIIPSQFSDTLAAKLDIINQAVWEGFPDDPTQSLNAIYDCDSQFESLPILRLDYDVNSPNPAYNGYSIKINRQDFSNPNFDKFIFYLKGAADVGIPDKLKLEFKNASGETGTYIIDNITGDWQKIEVDREDVNGLRWLSDWKDIIEINLVFEDHRVLQKEGRVYLAGFTYPESWQVAEAIDDFYSKVTELPESKQKEMLDNIVGEGVTPEFDTSKMEEIKERVLSSHDRIENNPGILGLIKVLEASNKKIRSYSNLRIISVLSSILSGKSDLDFGYTPSLYSLYRAAKVSGCEIYGFKLSNFDKLQNFFNNSDERPILVELKTGEYLPLTRIEGGGFLGLNRFVELNRKGETVKIDADEFMQLWSRHVLSTKNPESFQPLTNQQIYNWDNRGYILDSLYQEARELAEREYQPVEIEPVSVLDPPSDGRPETEGLVYQEYLGIEGDKFYEDKYWWAESRPRGSQNKYPLKVYSYDSDKRKYKEIKYNIENYDYSAPQITPPVEEIPPAGRYITAIDLGHILSYGKFPKFFTIGGDGYLRFIPLAEGREMGASFRVAGHNVTWSEENGDPENEDFPVVRKVYLKRVSDNSMKIAALLDCKAFTGVMNMKVKPGEETVMKVDAKFFPRRDILISEEPETGFAAFSSMFFLGDERNDELMGEEDEFPNTPWNPHDEAHDSDTLVVRYNDGSRKEVLINRPMEPGKVNIRDFGEEGKRITSFSLQQRDRNPDHYSAFPTSKYANRPSFDFNLIESNIPLKVKLYEMYTDNEYMDNIVTLLAIGRDLHKGEVINLKYEVVGYDYQK